MATLSTDSIGAAVVAVAFAASAYALSPGDSTGAGKNSPGLPLREALGRMMRLYGVPVMYVDSDVEGMRAGAECDRCPAAGALDSLLAGTDLIWLKIGEQYLVTRPERIRRRAVVTIAGSVEDGETHRPLEKAIVFLAGTTMGTSTSADGRFALPAAVTGGVDLVVSLVGYETRVVHLQLDGGDLRSMNIGLAPRAIEQEPVVVPGERQVVWERNLSDFEKAFIGAGECAEGCRLLNPWVIDFERRGDTLYASSDSLIWIENVSLGYRMCGFISGFEWDLSRDLGRWLVHLLFKEMAPESPDERLEWDARRRHLYHGSLTYFLRACIAKHVDEEGFELRSGERIEYNARWRVIPGDSVHIVRRPGTRFLEWNFPRWVRVDALAYGWHHAFVRVDGPFALIDSSGILQTPHALSVGGRWADDRAGSLLPHDYIPEETP